MTAKSLVLDLLSTMRGGSMPVALLVSAAEAFGIDENRVRVTLTRMGAQRLVERDERGHYFLGTGADSTMSRIASWRAVADATRPWRGDWLAVHIAAVEKSDRRARRKTNRALDLLSFKELNPDLLVRPDNLTSRVDDLRIELLALGADARLSCFGASRLGSDDEQRARSLWDINAIQRGYRHALDSMRESTKHLKQLNEQDAMVESFVVGGNVIRLLVMDPLLPEQIVPETDRHNVALALREYDRLGRVCWAPLLQRHGVRVKAAPGRLGTMGAMETMGKAQDSSPARAAVLARESASIRR